MTEGGKHSHEAVTQANIAVHSKAASAYESEEPHFRPESQARVRSILEALVGKDRERMLDLGCGTGFLTLVADGLFDTIVGVDATEAMIAQARARNYRSSVSFEVGDVLDYEAPQASFDLVGGYAFLHHLLDPGPVIAKAAQWVKPGGALYFDLEPNRSFWRDLERARDLQTVDSYPPAVRRELASVEGVLEAERYGVDEDTFALAEYGKKIVGGLAASELRVIVESLGLVSFRPIFHWFVGEAALVNDPSAGPDQNSTIRANVQAVLEGALPLSEPLFKYVGFCCRRPK